MTLRETAEETPDPRGWRSEQQRLDEEQQQRAEEDARCEELASGYLHPTSDCEISGIVASHSLIPEALHHAFATIGVLMSPALPLSRRQREMITTVVSTINRCHY